MRPARQSGFTLLEVMVALAILVVALTLIGSGIAQNVRQAQHARQVRLATLLVRQRMADIEADLYKNGFSDFPEEETGDFKDAGFPTFRWTTRAEKVELPANLGQSAADASRKLTDATSQLGQAGSGNTRAIAQAADSSMMSTLLSSFGGVIEQVKSAMEDSIRRVTVRVQWTEPPREEHLEVTAYFVDTTRMTVGTGGGVALPGGAGGPGGANLGGMGGMGGRGGMGGGGGVGGGGGRTR